MIDIVVLIICGMLSRAEDWEVIEAFRRSKLGGYDRQFVSLKNGVPSHDMAILKRV